MNFLVLRPAPVGWVVVAAAAGLMACSSSLPAGVPRDAAADMGLESGLDAGRDAPLRDTGTHDVTPDRSSSSCVPNSTFMPLPWEPPTRFNQGVCNAMQIQQYLQCFQIDACGMFFNIPANQACLGCIQTDVTAPAYGPVVTSGGAIQEVNFGGCQATFDGNASGSSCGAVNNAFNACIVAECGDCEDILMDGPMFQLCYAQAVAGGGPCAAYVETMACAAELEPDASAGACNDLGDFIGLWCGGEPGADGGANEAGDARAD
jgi:hypothetical protein